MNPYLPVDSTEGSGEQAETTTTTAAPVVTEPLATIVPVEVPELKENEETTVAGNASPFIAIGRIGRIRNNNFEWVDHDSKTMITIAVKTLKLFIKTHLKSH